MAKSSGFKRVRESALLRSQIALPAGVTLHATFYGPIERVNCVCWSPDGKRLASGSSDERVQLWDSNTGRLVRILESHTGRVRSVCWSPDSRLLASGSDDETVLLWDSTNDKLPRILEGHKGPVRSVAWSPNGKRLASGSDDQTVRLWNPTTGKRMWDLGSHTNRINSVGWSPDGKLLASGSDDETVRLWNPTTGKLAYVLKSHNGGVESVCWSPDGKRLASGSSDGTVQLWDPTTSKLLRTLEGHSGGVESVCWSPDGRLLASGSVAASSPYDADIRIWHTATWELIAVITDLERNIDIAWHPLLPMVATPGKQEDEILVWHLDLEHLLQAIPSLETVHYTNAKVVLLGDSGVGKSGLGLVLSGQPFVFTESTHGRHVWTFESQEVSIDEQRRETRETLLWDLAGQPGYRLIHQLYLNEVAVALVVFDAHSETDPFAGVGHWSRALRQAQRIQGNTALPVKKFLVAARIDRGGTAVTAARIQAVVNGFGFDGYFETSAKEGWQIRELRQEIRQGIGWEALPKVSSTVLFQLIKEFLVDEKKRARRLISTVEDLYSIFLNSRDAPTETPELPAQFETCIGRVESAGLIKRLSFGKFVLLQPELLDAYASALVNFVKDEPDGLGSIAEEQVRAGDFRIPSDERIQDAEQEKLLLIAMIEDLLRRELVLREEGILIFPSQSTKENPDLLDPENKAVVFEFEGPVLNIYATLAVRLAHSGLFEKKELWKNAITYITSLEGTYGMSLRNIGEGRGELTLFFDEVASRDMRRVFEEYVHLHLKRRALQDSLRVHVILACDVCNTLISNQQIQRRKARNLDWLNCPVCDTHVSLVERKRQSPTASSSGTQEMDLTADIQRDREADQLTLQGKMEIGDFDVFLCYHDRDKPVIKQIGKRLKELGILPWLDEWELRPGVPWQQLLEQQIKRIKAAAVFVGMGGMGPWQEQELRAFLNEFVNRSCPVIPVLLADAPQKPALPIFLKAMTWVDFRVKDPDPMQQLLWGITGRREMRKGM